MSEREDEIEDDAIATDDRYRAPALDRGLDILEALSRQTRGLSRVEIVKEVGLSASQIYRVLERLVARGYVARVEGGDRYALSMSLFLLATDHPPVRRLIAQVQPSLDRFADEMRQSLHLVIPDRGSAVVMAQASPVENWEFRARIGGRLDLFSTGSGLTLLAFQSPDRVVQTLRTWGLDDDIRPRLAAVAADLEEIRAKGYRDAPSRQLVGVTDLSVPMLDMNGNAYAALTCAFVDHPDDDRSDLRREALQRLRDLGTELALHRSKDAAG